MNVDRKLPPGFVQPTATPDEPESREAWQDSNRTWWERNPMRYDWRRRVAAEEFTPEYFAEIDRRFFADSNRYAPAKERPFDRLIPFDALRHLDVLEIGVGSGSHAALIAPWCRRYIGVDLTAFAVQSTRTRFEQASLPPSIVQMDAEMQAFPAETFDFVWSWGVIHHTADPRRALKEIHRVLKRGGTATTMVYHRSFLYYYVFNAFLRGVLGGGFLRGRTLHELVQLHTDGALARFYRPDEWCSLVESAGFTVANLQVMGQKSELFPLPASRLKDLLIRTVPDSLGRLVLDRFRQGSFLVSTIRKAD